MINIQELICCPKCRGDLIPHIKDDVAVTGRLPHYYACTVCGLEYPVVNGVPDFLPPVNGVKKKARKLMESEHVVEIYESKWWRANKFFEVFMGISLEDEIALIRKITAIGPSDTVLDLACGPGLYARRFAEESPDRNVMGLDLSWPMLKHGTGKAAKLGLENLIFIHGDAHLLPIRDSSVDVANCGAAFHLLPDVRRVAAELSRVIRPGGRFSMSVLLNRQTIFSAMKAYLDEMLWGVRYFRQEELKALLDAAGFEPAIYHARGIWMIACSIRRP